MHEKYDAGSFRKRPRMPLKPKVGFLLFFFMVSVLLCAGVLGAQDWRRDPLPDWFVPLRDAIYEQTLDADAILPLYRAAKQRAEALPFGTERYTLLSRCEYMMGRAYHYEERKEEAISRYDAGIAWAERALEIQAAAEAYQMLAENISQSCAVRPASYAIANGLKVERYAKNALDLDPRNTAARIMIAARWVYAPAPFNNLTRGIQMMEEILDQYDGSLPRDDRFNVYCAIGYAYARQKKHAEARPWLERALGVYPANNYIKKLLVQR